jgi:hypothetical protein
MDSKPLMFGHLLSGKANSISRIGEEMVSPIWDNQYGSMRRRTSSSLTLVMPHTIAKSGGAIGNGNMMCLFAMVSLCIPKSIMHGFRTRI